MEAVGLLHRQSPKMLLDPTSWQEGLSPDPSQGRCKPSGAEPEITSNLPNSRRAVFSRIARGQPDGLQACLAYVGSVADEQVPPEMDAKGEAVRVGAAGTQEALIGERLCRNLRKWCSGEQSAL